MSQYSIEHGDGYRIVYDPIPLHDASALLQSLCDQYEDEKVQVDAFLSKKMDVPMVFGTVKALNLLRKQHGLDEGLNVQGS